VASQAARAARAGQPARTLSGAWTSVSASLTETNRGSFARWNVTLCWKCDNDLRPFALAKNGEIRPSAFGAGASFGTPEGVRCGARGSTSFSIEDPSPEAVASGAVPPLRGRVGRPRGRLDRVPPTAAKLYEGAGNQPRR
jgi:hypothetical protein